MPISQKIFALLISSCTFIFIIEMVRRKKLREEYSILWLATAVGMLALILKYDWLVALTKLIGAELPTSTLFLGSIIFLILIAVQFSIKLSSLTEQVKNLAQHNSLLEAELKRLLDRQPDRDEQSRPS
jgi:hypothetical protein